VIPGETALAFYTVKNKTEQAILGVATYNVHPPKAGLYFNKIQCFCFDEQRLKPREEIDMPVSAPVCLCVRACVPVCARVGRKDDRGWAGDTHHSFVRSFVRLFVDLILPIPLGRSSSSSTPRS